MPKRKCPTSWKIAHATEGAAKAHQRSLWGKSGIAGARFQHAYKCKCGAWHVGGVRKRGGRKRKQW